MSEKCAPDDPRRCQGVTPHGQCEYLATEGHKYCNYHAQGNGVRAQEKKKAERYMIDRQELRQSYLRQQGDQDYLDLKDEILLATAILERRLNAMQTDQDILMAVGPATQLLQRLESMKISLMKLQQQLGLVLSVDKLRSLAQKVADILDEELEGVPDKDDKMDTIAERIFLALEESREPETKD